MSCRELVELVTDYLEGALDDLDRARFERHLDDCGGCRTYLSQMRQTIELTGALREDELDQALVDELTQAFRDWRRGPLIERGPHA